MQHKRLLSRKLNVLDSDFSSNMISMYSIQSKLATFLYVNEMYDTTYWDDSFLITYPKTREMK